MIKGRICKFKVNPGNYNPFKPSFKHYYTVHIFESKEDLYAYSHRLRSWEYREDNYAGIVIPFRRERYIEDKWICKPKIGDVLLCKNRLYSRIVSHEAVHMSTHFLRVLGLLNLNSQIDDSEELLAYCIGNCTSEIYKKLYDLKVL